MTVTILVPVYGVEKYIAECAHSLFRQTYQDIEYVFCDDCTPDRSIEVLRDVIEQYPERKPHVRIIKNEVNKGLGGSRVYLISEIKTDYFMIVDSDDVLPENSVETLVQRMKETDTDIVEGSFCKYTNSNISSNVERPCHDKSDIYVKKMQVGGLLYHNVWGKLYKTSILEKIPDMFVEGINMAEDYCATTRIVAISTRSWTDDVVYLYRVDQQSFFIKEMSDNNILSYLKATKTVYNFYKERGRVSLPVEVGILRVYRQCLKEQRMTLTLADNIVGYKPERLLTRFLQKTLCSPIIPYKIKDLIYKAIRMYAIYV